MVKRSFKILQQKLEDFWSVSDHSELLRNKGIRSNVKIKRNRIWILLTRNTGLSISLEYSGLNCKIYNKNLITINEKCTKKQEAWKISLPEFLFLLKLQAESLQLYWKEAPAQVFLYEFCYIFMNTFFTEHLRSAASEIYKTLL